MFSLKRSSAPMNLPQMEDGRAPHSEEPTKWTEEKDSTVDEDLRFHTEVGEIYRDCSQFRERHMKLALTRETSEDFYKQWKLVMGEKSQLGQRLQRLRVTREEELKRWPEVAKWLEEVPRAFTTRTVCETNEVDGGKERDGGQGPPLPH
jgi:hypothetical protein